MKIDPLRLRALLTSDWTPERHNAGLQRLQRAEPSSRRGWIVASLGVAAAAAVVLALVMSSRDAELPHSAPVSSDDAIAEASPSVTSPTPAPSVTPVTPAPPPSSRVAPLQFRDGSVVVPDDVDSDLIIAEAGPTMTRVELRRGGARFDVTPDPERRFRVEAGLVTVDVLGTEFHCLRQDNGVTVEVIRGQVSVSWPGDAVVLARGDSGSFPPPPTDPAPAVRSPSATAELRWNRLAHKGKHVAAYEALRRGQKVGNRAEELMLAADVARRAGHPAAALPYLRRVVDDHRTDSRAPLAAFTMGRIEQARGKHRRAATHFAEVRTMKGSALTEHALAREVESWLAAGDRVRAKRGAAEYLARYPEGPRAQMVRRALGAGEH